MQNSENQVTMGMQIKQFIASRAEAKEVALLKDKPKKNKKTGSESGGINTRLAALIQKNRSKLNSDQLEAFESVKKTKKIKAQSDIEFQRGKLEKLKLLASEIELGATSEILDEYENFTQWIKSNFEPKKWLSDNCKDALGVSFATHVAKLTHSRIKGASSLFDYSESVSPRYLTTSSLALKHEDSALDDAKFAPVANLLKLSDSSKTLDEYIASDSVTPFLEFTENIELARKWVADLKEALDSSRKSSHILAKQTYWPIEENRYQLLLPVKSSALAHTLYLKFSSFFEATDVAARKQRTANKYSPEMICYYPNKAVLKVTASNHTNASALNGKRGGRLSLLSCSPPSWSLKLRPPIQQKSLFGYLIERRTSDAIEQLRKILLSIKLKKSSIKEPNNHKAIVNLVEDITDEVLDYAASIQALKELTGWSCESRLPKSHQYFLDPYRDDEDFQSQRADGSWKKEIAQNFGDWLNARLRYKANLQLGPIQAGLWRDLFHEKLRLFITEMEVTQ